MDGDRTGKSKADDDRSRSNIPPFAQLACANRPYIVGKDPRSLSCWASGVPCSGHFLQVRKAEDPQNEYMDGSEDGINGYRIRYSMNQERNNNRFTTMIRLKHQC